MDFDTDTDPLVEALADVDTLCDVDFDSEFDVETLGLSDIEMLTETVHALVDVLLETLIEAE